jgi:hypothetical protein
VTQRPELVDNVHVLDEDAESRRHIRQTLTLTYSERLRTLTGAYPLFVVGQRRIGRPIYKEET